MWGACTLPSGRRGQVHGMYLLVGEQFPLTAILTWPDLTLPLSPGSIFLGLHTYVLGPLWDLRCSFVFIFVFVFIDV